MPRTFGTADHLDSSTVPATAPPFSMGLWVNTTAVQARKYMTLSVGTDPNNMYSIGQDNVSATGRAAVDSFHGGTNSQNLSSSALTASTWQWVSGTWSGTSPNITEVARIAGGNRGSGGGVTAPIGTISRFGISGRPSDHTQPLGGGAAHASFFSRSYADIEDAYLGAGGNPRGILGAAHFYAINTASGTEPDRIGSLNLTVTGTTAFVGAGPDISTWWTAASLGDQTLTQGTLVPSVDLTTKFEDLQAPFTCSLLQVAATGIGTTATAPATTSSTALTVASATGVVKGMYASIAGGAKTPVLFVSGNTVLLQAAQTWANAAAVTFYAVAAPTALTGNGVSASGTTYGGGTPGAGAVGSFAGCFLRATNANNSAVFADSPLINITVASSSTNPSFTSGPMLSSANLDGYTFGATSNQTATGYLVTMLRGSTAPSSAQMLSGSPSGFVSRVTVAATAATPFSVSSTGLGFPVYDSYLMLNNGGGSSAIAPFTNQLKVPPAGKQYTPLVIKTISGITNASPAVVNATAHGRATGQWVEIWGVAGMTQINGAFSTVTVIDANHFALDTVDSSAYGAYVSGGIHSWGQSYLFNASVTPATGDIGVCDSTDPQGNPAILRDDGVVAFTTTSTDRQNVTVDFYSVSARAMVGPGNGYMNDQAPIAPPSGTVLPGIFVPKNIGFSANLASLLGMTDAQGDTLVGFNTTALPVGFATSSGAINGSTTVDNSITVVNFRFPNNSGEFTDVLANVVLGDIATPSLIGSDFFSGSRIANGLYFTVAPVLSKDDANTAGPAAAGTIIDQFPPVGTLAPPGTSIQFTLSTGNGAATTTTPPPDTTPALPPPPIQNSGSIIARLGGVQLVLSDLFHYWGADVTLSNTQDLLTVSGVAMGQQRVLRRLLTNQGDYLFDPTYGAGLPSYVGQTADIAKITALITSQILLEPAVSPSPAPVITVAAAASDTDASALSISVQYTDRPSGRDTTLSFTLSQ